MYWCGLRMNFQYQTEVVDDKGFIVITGDFDDEQAGEALRKAFNSLFDNGIKTIVLDLQAVEIINSYGVGKILICDKRLKSVNGVLMLKPLTGFVKEIFELLMLDKYFPVYELEPTNPQEK
jgi:anti-anti-sigma factor